MTIELDHPLRLATGTHAAGSGKGCVMNLIAWETGETTITDFPSCADPMLARIAQRVNDRICTHSGDDMLCPECSQIMLELGHRTVGTANLPITEHERHVIYVKIALDQARSVAHLVSERYKDRANRALEAAQAWIDNPCEETRRNVADSAVGGVGADAAAYAAAAAANAAYAAYAAAANAASAAAYAADAADAADWREHLLASAKRAFDLFEELTAHVAPGVSDEEIARAYACMTASA